MKFLVIENKWLKILSSSMQNELDYVSEKLYSRIRELAERYEAPLPKLINEVDNFSNKVEEHLKGIGKFWK